MQYSDLKQWAAKIDRMPEDLPPVVRKILACAANPTEVLDPCTRNIAPAETEAWLIAFAKGVQYSYETYGHAPENFGIFNRVGDDRGNENTNMVMYDAGNDYIVITRDFIAIEIKNARGLGAVFSNSNTGTRKDFAALEMATLLGVEECYHAYQFKFMLDKYSAEDRNGAAKFADAANATEENKAAHYKENAIERDASIAVLKAADDLGFGRQPKTAPPSPFSQYNIC